MEEEQLQQREVDEQEEKRWSEQARARRYRQRVQRRTRALELRMDGKTYEAIAQELGVSCSQAHIDVRRALMAHSKDEREAVEELRRLEEQRLDVAVGAIMAEVKKGNLPAVDRLVRVSARRSKLLGLDMPVQATDADREPLTIKVEYPEGDDGSW